MLLFISQSHFPHYIVISPQQNSNRKKALGQELSANYTYSDPPSHPLAPPDYPHPVMAGSGCTLCWLIPVNKAALDIVYDEANSAFRDTVPVLPRPNQLSESLAADEKERLDCLRVGFDRKPTQDCLVAFGRDPYRSDIFLRETHYSRTQAYLYIHPISLDLICRDYSSFRTTSLLFDEDCGSVGRWNAVEHFVHEQALLPSRNPVLDLCGAHFTFQWFPPSEERELRVAKEHFLQRDISENERRTAPREDLFSDGKHLTLIIQSSMDIEQLSIPRPFCISPPTSVT